MTLLQRDITTLYRWSQTWQLPLNLSKSKCLVISNKRTPPVCHYNINNTTLENVDTFKYLGVLIDSKLKWSAQVNATASKASRTLNLLRRNLRGSPKSIRERAYKALVRPHLEFSAPVWAPHQTKDIVTLEKVQKRAARWATATWNPNTFRWNKSYEECCGELRWPTLQQRRDWLTLYQTYKIVNHLDCLDFDTYYSHSASSTRSHNLSLECKTSRINSYRYSFFIKNPFLWNTLPYSVSSSTSYNCFKRSLFSHFVKSS